MNNPDYYKTTKQYDLNEKNFSILNKKLSEKMLSKNKSERLLAMKMKTKWNQARDDADRSSKRNRQLKNDFDRISSHIKLLSDRIDRQKKIKDDYASMIDIKYPGWMKIASKCETFEDARRYSENQAQIKKTNYEHKKMAREQMRPASYDSLARYGSDNFSPLDSMTTARHAFPREIPQTLHHNYPIPTQDECSLHQQELQYQHLVPEQHGQSSLDANPSSSKPPPHTAHPLKSKVSSSVLECCPSDQSMAAGSTAHQQIMHTHPPSAQHLTASQMDARPRSHHHGPPPEAIAAASSDRFSSSSLLQLHNRAPPHQPSPPHPFQQNPPLTTSYESARAHLSSGHRGNAAGNHVNNMAASTHSSVNLDALGSIYDDTIGSLNNTMHKYRDRLAMYDDSRMTVKDEKRSVTSNHSHQRSASAPARSSSPSRYQHPLELDLVEDAPKSQVSTTNQSHLLLSSSQAKQSQEAESSSHVISSLAELPGSNRCSRENQFSHSQSSHINEHAFNLHHNTGESPMFSLTVEKQQQQLPLNSNTAAQKSTSFSSISRQQSNNPTTINRRDSTHSQNASASSLCQQPLLPTPSVSVTTCAASVDSSCLATPPLPAPLVLKQSNPHGNSTSPQHITTTSNRDSLSSQSKSPLRNSIPFQSSATSQSKLTITPQPNSLTPQHNQVSPVSHQVKPANSQQSSVVCQHNTLSNYGNSSKHSCDLSQQNLKATSKNSSIIPQRNTNSSQPKSKPSQNNSIASQPKSNPSQNNSIASQPKSNPSQNNSIASQPKSNPSHQNSIVYQHKSNPSHQNSITSQHNSISSPNKSNPLQHNSIISQPKLNPSQHKTISSHSFSSQTNPAILEFKSVSTQHDSRTLAKALLSPDVPRKSSVDEQIIPVIPSALQPRHTQPRYLHTESLPASRSHSATQRPSLHPIEPKPRFTSFDRYLVESRIRPQQSIPAHSSPCPSSNRQPELTQSSTHHFHPRQDTHYHTTRASAKPASTPSPVKDLSPPTQHFSLIADDSLINADEAQTADHGSNDSPSRHSRTTISQATLSQHATPLHSMPVLKRCTSPSPSNVSRSSHNVARPVTIPAAQQYQCSSPDRTISNVENSPVRYKESEDLTEDLVPSQSCSSFQGKRALLSTSGLYSLLTAINTSLKGPTPRAECFYRTIAPQDGVRASIIETANSGNTLRHMDVTQLTMVVRDQLPLVIGSECHNTGLLDDHLLTSDDLLTLTSDDVSYRLEESSVELWFEISYHMTQLRRHDIMSASEIAAVFSPSMIHSRSPHQDKVHQLILSLMGRVKVQDDVNFSPETSTMISITNKSLETESLVHREVSVGLESTPLASPRDIGVASYTPAAANEKQARGVSSPSKKLPTDKQNKDNQISSKMIIENLAKQIIRLNSESDEEEDDDFFSQNPPNDLRNSTLYKSLASAASRDIDREEDDDDGDGFSDIDDMLNPRKAQGQGHLRESNQSADMQTSANPSTLGYLSASAADVSQTSATQDYVDGHTHGDTDSEDQYNDDEEFTTKKKVLDLMAQALNANIEEFE